VCDSSDVEYLKECVNLNSIAHLIDRKRCKFIDSLMSDVRFSNLLLVWVELCVICFYVLIYFCLFILYFFLVF